MRFETILPLLGEFGPYQKRIYFLVCLPAILCAMHSLAWVFLGARVDHRCQLPFETEDSPFDKILFPNSTDIDVGIDPKLVYPQGDSKCSHFDVDFTNEYFSYGEIPQESVIKSCEKFIYDKSRYKSSVVTEYNIVCDRKHRHAHINSVFMIGLLFGSITFGFLSDRYGRRPIFFLSLVLQVTFGLLTSFVPNLYTFMIIRMLLAASNTGIFLIGFVIAMEMVGTSYRVFAGIICQMFFAFGYFFTAILAYYIRDWRNLQIALSLPGLVFLSYIYFLPESVRWLLVKGRTEEARIILKKVAKENGVVLPDHVYESLHEVTTNEEKKPPSANLFHLVKYPKLLLRSINIFFCWIVNNCIYYGLSLSTSNLGGNDFINFGLSGAVEIPAYIFLIFTLNRVGRKLILCWSLIAGGVAMTLCAIIPEEMNWLLITNAMLGKFFISASYAVIYLYTAEIFPTVIRNTGMGASSLFARLGGILSSYILILNDVWKPLPIIIFGSAALIAGMLALLMPETLGKRLPETLEDGENFGTAAYDEQNDEEKTSKNGTMDQKI